MKPMSNVDIFTITDELNNLFVINKNLANYAVVGEHPLLGEGYSKYK